MKRLTKALNEALDNNIDIMEVGKSDKFGFQKSRGKSTAAHNYMYTFDLGDYVYYSEDMKYNSLIGDLVGICVDDTPRKELFASFNKDLMHSWPWARVGSDLYEDSIPDFGNGIENTEYIKKNFANDLDKTIWSKIRDNEYIPSASELEIIYKNAEICLDIWKKLPLFKQNYWTSSLHKNQYSNHEANIVNFNYGYYDEYFGRICANVKGISLRAIALINRSIKYKL